MLYVQTCSELLMPMCNNGTTDMFEPLPWNYEGFSDQCYSNFGVRPRPFWAETEYGGDRLQAASNIIFRCEFSRPAGKCDRKNFPRVF